MSAGPGLLQAVAAWLARACPSRGTALAGKQMMCARPLSELNKLL
jgi:hypothetical protein